MYGQESNPKCQKNFLSLLKYIASLNDSKDFIREIIKEFSERSFLFYLESNLTSFMNQLSQVKSSGVYGENYIESITIY